MEKEVDVAWGEMRREKSTECMKATNPSSLELWTEYKMQFSMTLKSKSRRQMQERNQSLRKWPIGDEVTREERSLSRLTALEAERSRTKGLHPLRASVPTGS